MPRPAHRRVVGRPQAGSLVLRITPEGVAVFEVHVPDLTDNAVLLDGDAGSVADAGRAAVRAGQEAASSCGGGALAGVLARLDHGLGGQATALTLAVRAAGDTLASNATTYEHADRSAADRLGRVLLDPVGPGLFDLGEPAR